MQQQELLSQLQDIQLPDPIGWWPLAFSWWIMIFTVTSILIGVLWYYLDLKRRNVYRVSAMKRLDEIMSPLAISDTDKISAMNSLLKQVALTAFGRNKTAALKGQEWVNFLAETCNYIPQPEGLSKVIELGYRNEDAEKPEVIHQAAQVMHDYAQKWIKGHHQ